MSNLGWYQKMTTYSKKVGGPVNFLTMVAGGGYCVGKLIELGIKKVVDKAKKHTQVSASQRVYCVHSLGQSNEGISFNIGDKYRVLEQDKDVVLIEKIGDASNPYFVSASFLQSISDYR